MVLAFAHREAADGVAVETDSSERRSRLVPQVRVGAALDDTEQGMAGAWREGCFGALGPAHGEPHG